MRYVPILRWKKGEQDALANLDDEIKDSIMPVLVIAPGEKITSQFMSKIESCWRDREYYFQLNESWYSEIESENDYYSIFQKFYNGLDKDFAIPVINLSEINIVSGHKDNFKHGLCIRVQNNEYELVETVLNDFAKTYGHKNIDLLLDLKHIKMEDLYEKTSLIKATVTDIDNITEYRKIIVASASFPKEMSNIDNHTIYKFQRIEKLIHEKMISIAEKINFNYVYGDYVLSDLSEVEFAPWISPSFKIRYTYKDSYYFIKGKSLKKGGLDYSEVQHCCQLVYNESFYCGVDYSWGDSVINDIAHGNALGTGNLTNWVAYTYNHHMALISKI